MMKSTQVTGEIYSAFLTKKKFTNLPKITQFETVNLKYILSFVRVQIKTIPDRSGLKAFPTIIRSDLR